MMIGLSYALNQPLFNYGWLIKPLKISNQIRPTYLSRVWEHVDGLKLFVILCHLG